MLQEYWLLLPQRLELVQYLSQNMAFVTVKALTTAFTPVPHFLRLRQRFVFPEQHLVEVLPHRRSLPLHLASLLVVLSVYWKVLTDGHLRLLLNLSFYSLQHIHTIPKAKFLSSGSSQFKSRLLSSWT